MIRALLVFQSCWHICEFSAVPRGRSLPTWLRSPSPDSVTYRAAARRRQVVERWKRTRLSQRAPSLVRVCRIVGLSERGLRNAFYEVRGMSPKRCMLRERDQGPSRVMRGARQGANGHQYAADSRFFELGRFAASYQHVFAEAPSSASRPGAATGERRPNTKGGR